MFELIKKILPFLLTVSVFTSCKNDLNIIAPYKESVSVYGVLNPQQDIQIIRVNKIFLGEGNAYDMAQVKDSINYPTGILTVSLERYVNGVKSPTTKGDTKTEIVLKDTIIQAQPGVFNTNQNCFYTKDKLFTSGDYKLIVKNNSTGKLYTSQTSIIDSILPTIYHPLREPYYPVPYFPSNPSNYYIDYSLPDVKRTIRFISIKNAKAYHVTMRFHYVDSLIDQTTQSKYVDVNLSQKISTGIAGGEEILNEFYSDEIYSKLYSEIKKIDNESVLFRRFLKIDYIVYAASKDYYNFLQISAPSNSIAQEKPAYSNISDGYGVFAARSRFHIQKQFSTLFIDYMATHKPTCQLRFLKSSGLPSFDCN